ncbi:hypothetical protein NAT47_04775 [Flavobacterium sp. HXWNR69]|uniref:Fibronectin type-III domain-containing protein n=1 Tax=Flavobacterium fragile TaxID=2949085 RepID=A0ABT0TFH4_9FLAO|nr:hypothetical protein [Flavobacterium sp. HXWNR69]MCL9769724.1 hypothetical protein [Flavobacterium sp. HXWNR69]
MNLKMFVSFSQRRLVFSILTLFLTFLFVNKAHAQYSGTGTFTKIASTAELTDGYYVITNASSTRAMSNVQGIDGSNQPVLLTQAINPLSGVIQNPSNAIVWRIETNASGKTIYSESSARYLNYTGTSWGVNLTPSITNNFQRWTIAYSVTEVVIRNLGDNTNRLTYFDSATPDFSYYDNGGEENLQLYKMNPLANPATNITSNSFTANWQPTLGATSYRLDVSTTPFIKANIIGWSFPTTGTDGPDITSTNNTANTLTTNAGTISTAPGLTSSAASVDQWSGGSGSDYWQIQVNTLGHYNITLNAVQYSQANGPRDFIVQYRIGTGGTWTNIPGGTIVVGSNYSRGVTNLNLPSICDNKTSVFIRWLMNSNTAVDGNSVQNTRGWPFNYNGASRIDDIVLRSEVIPSYVNGYQDLNVGNVTTYNVSGLSSSTTYYYRVRAVYNTSTSPNSNVIQVKTYQDINIADFRSRATGDYSTATTWEFDSGIPTVGWVIATQPPGANNNVLIQAPHTVTMTANASFNSGKTLTVNGTLATATHSITGAGSITVPSGGVVASGNLSATDAFAGSLAVTGAINFQTGSTFELNGTAKQYLGARTFSNLKISNTTGVKALGNLTVDGELSLAANPNDTDGALDMVIDYGTYATNKYGTGDYANSTLAFNNLNSYILTMGATATTAGPGDVTGKIRRTTIADNTTYTFGNVNTQLRFTSVSGSALPTQITVVATRGDHGTHIDNTGGVLINGYTANRNTLKRMYQFLRTGGSTNSRFTLRMAYQDAELNGNTNESNLVTWDHHIPYGGRTPHEHGKTSFDPTGNWVELSNHSVSYLATEGDIAFTKYWMLSTKETISDYVWTGAVSSSWNILTNWSGGKVPNDTADVLIPDAAITNNDPVITTASGYGILNPLPTFIAGEVRMRSLEIATGGLLTVQNGQAAKITIYGGPNANGGGINYGSWDNKGTFAPGNSKVIFDYDATASESTISGTTQFYDVEIASGKKATLQADAQVLISNALVNNGTFDAASFPNTITYNGTTAQTVLPTTYRNLTIANGVSATLGGNATTLNTLSLSDKFLTTGSFKMTMGTSGVVSRTTGFVKGTLEKPLASTPSLFEIGTTVYAPVTVASTGLSGSVLVAAKATTGTPSQGSVLNASAKSDTYWTLTKSGAGSITNYTASFDIANTTNTGTLSRYRIAHCPASSWNILPTPTIAGTLYTTPTRTTFGDFELGEVKKTTWTGSAWTPVLPDIYTDAEIAGPYTSATNGGSFSANSLTINADQTVDITDGYAVTVANEIVNNSTSNGITVQNNANLLQLNDVVNSGMITVRRTSAPMLRLDYTFWSSPVLGQNLYAFSPLTLSNRFYLFDTPTNYYSAAGLNSSTTFTPGVAYVIRTPNNHSSTTPTPYNGVFTGVPNNGKYTFTLNSSSYGYNGVGNPYPSPLDASKFVNDNPDIDGTLYFFAHTGTGNAAGQFATWTPGSGGVAATTQTSGAGTTVKPNGIIQVGQGFVVKSQPAGGTVVFNNEQRVVDANNQFYRSATLPSHPFSTTSSIERHRIWLNLSSVNATGALVMENQTLVAYAQGATIGVDRGYDGLVYSTYGTQLTSKLDNRYYVVQGRPLPFDRSDVVPLAFKAGVAGTFEISIATVDGVFADPAQAVYLRDLTTGLSHNLKTSPYRFTSDAGSFDTRFELFYPNISLGATDFDAPAPAVVYVSNDVLHIDSLADALSEVRIFDLAGRLLFEASDLDTMQFRTQSLPLRNEVYLIQYKTIRNVVFTQKVIY